MKLTYLFSQLLLVIAYLLQLVLLAADTYVAFKSSNRKYL